MPATPKLTPCEDGWPVDEPVQLVETDASRSLSGFDGCDGVSSAVTSDSGGSPTCKNDNTEDSQMKLKRQQIAMPTEEDEDEYTFSAFGDISLSNICFVPGPLAALSPERKANKSASAMSRPVEHFPKVIRKILAPSPSKAFVSSVEMDFETIVNNLKQTRDKVKPQPPLVTSRKPFGDRDGILYSPQPQRLIDLQNFGIVGSHDIDEPIRRVDELVSATPAGNPIAKNRHGKHARWGSNRTSGEGISYHLGLKPALWLT